MAKKKSARKKKLSVGQQVRIKEGVTAPEFPEVSCTGWSGTVIDLIGKKTDPQYVIEWDEVTLNGMPSSYKDQCEERHLTYSYSCFPLEDLETGEA